MGEDLVISTGRVLYAILCSVAPSNELLNLCSDSKAVKIISF